MNQKSDRRGAGAAEALKILRLIRLLPSGAKTTTAELADRLARAGTPMSERSLQRTLRALADAPDFPVICDDADRSHRWGWDPRAALLTAPEPSHADAVLLRLAGRLLVQHVPERLLSDLRPQLRLSGSSVLPVCALPDCLPRSPASVRPEVLEAAAKAYAETRRLKMRYRENRRTLEAAVTVLGLFEAAGALYLVCLPEKDAAPVRIALNRIVDARVTVFAAAPAPDAFSLTAYAQAQDVNPNRGELIRLSFLTSAGPLLASLRAQPLSSSQTISPEKEDFRVTAVVPDSPLLSAWLTLHAGDIRDVCREAPAADL